jgi:lipoprotein-anchoring transpeptidase ErfK/SrfK
MIRSFLIFLAILFLGLIFFVSMVLFAIPALQESTLVLPSMIEVSRNSAAAETDQQTLETDIAKLRTKLEKLTPTDAYMVVNTSDNHYYLYKGKKLIRNGVCSTGKNERLVSAERNYEHIFHTPFGVRKVLRKQTNPVWKKPDWSFIEDGLPIPSPNDPSRYETGTLGAYKLEIGDGFMIHGTIYKRRMGMSVTHGCIRLLDEDLEVVYKTMEIGSKVYIY